MNQIRVGEESTSFKSEIHDHALLTSQLGYLQNILPGFLTDFDFNRVTSSPHAQYILRAMEDEDDDLQAAGLFSTP
ncbi:protein translocase subunit SecD [Sesbania bispinosa]|nr:protein translocase subunit SecD [Sesbania bispinosa]